MKYFKQKTQTDCLLASLECLTQFPRKKMSKEMVRFETFCKKRFFTYNSAAKLLETHLHKSSLVVVDENNIKFQPPIYKDKKAIVGVAGKGAFHAMYWDGEKIWEPFQGKFMDPYFYYKVVYVINKDISWIPHHTVKSLRIWDENLKKNKAKQEELLKMQKVYDGPVWHFRVKNP